MIRDFLPVIITGMMVFLVLAVVILEMIALGWLFSNLGKVLRWLGFIHLRRSRDSKNARRSTDTGTSKESR